MRRMKGRRLAAMHDDNEQDQASLRARLARLEIEHEDLDHAIDALIRQGADALRIQRFKKKKLSIKDEITRLHAQILPDIIA